MTNSNWKHYFPKWRIGSGNHGSIWCQTCKLSFLFSYLFIIIFLIIIIYIRSKHWTEPWSVAQRFTTAAVGDAEVRVHRLEARQEAWAIVAASLWPEWTCQRGGCCFFNTHTEQVLFIITFISVSGIVFCILVLAVMKENKKVSFSREKCANC